MIIVEGWLRVGALEIERLRGAATTMMTASRAEDGCEEFAFTQDLADSDLFRIVERWRDEAALAAHFATPHMAAFQEAMSKTSRADGSVKIYKATLDRVMVGD